MTKKEVVNDFINKNLRPKDETTATTGKIEIRISIDFETEDIKIESNADEISEEYVEDFYRMIEEDIPKN